jgi:hypothetical protein
MGSCPAETLNVTSNEQAIIEWVERQWPDGPAFECAQLLRASVLKLQDCRIALAATEGTQAELDSALSRLGEAEKHLRAAANCLGHAPVTKGCIEDFLGAGVVERQK